MNTRIVKGGEKKCEFHKIYVRIKQYMENNLWGLL